MAVTGGTGLGTSEAPTSRTPSMQSASLAGMPSAVQGLNSALARMPAPIAASAQGTVATQELDGPLIKSSTSCSTTPRTSA